MHGLVISLFAGAAVNRVASPLQTPKQPFAKAGDFALAVRVFHISDPATSTVVPNP